MNPKFISLQGSYKQLQIALYYGKTCIDTVLEESSRASSMLIPHIQNILSKHQYALTDLSFIAVDAGPGAFTSLRVMIATVNALAYATKVPLIGIDGLDALAYQTKQQAPVVSGLYCVLLNAFNQEVFFGVYNQNLEPVLAKGYKNIDELLGLISQLDLKDPLIFSGNGTTLFKQKIEAQFGARAQFVVIEVAGVEVIGSMALGLWSKGIEEPCYKITPKYMKLQSYAVKT